MPNEVTPVVDDRKADIEAAFDAAEKATPAPAPEKAEVAPAVTPEKPAPAPEKAEVTSQEGRDEKGRFAPKEKPAEGEEKPQAATPAPGQEPQKPEEKPPVQLAVKAPRSWKPEAREEWSKLSPGVQAEVSRREREISVALQESAEARQFTQKFRDITAPYEAMIRAEGGDSITAVKSLLQTAAALRTAPPAYKAQIVASMIQGYGVDIDALASILTGQAVSPQAQQQAPMRDPRLDELLSEVQQARRSREKQAYAEAEKALAEVQDLEFYGDVRLDMADLMELAARRGLILSPMDAYNRAVAQRPEISKVLAQREAATRTQQPVTPAARAAASSIRSSPVAPSAPAGGQDRRSDIEAAWSDLAGK